MTITGNFRKWNVIFKRRATLLNAIADLQLTEIQKIQKQTDNNRSSKKLSFHQAIASELLDGQHQLLTDFKSRINHLLDWKFLIFDDSWFITLSCHWVSCEILFFSKSQFRKFEIFRNPCYNPDCEWFNIMLKWDGLKNLF